MIKLSDTQSVILAQAAARDGGSLYPLPGTLRRNGGTMKALAAMVKAGWAAERETSDASAAHRLDGDLRFGLFVTQTGLAVIGVTGDEGVVAPMPAPAEVRPAVLRITKAGTVLALLQRNGGATLSELIAATGWLPHTTRAALTGLRKKGHSVVRGTRAGATCYRIEVAA